MKELKLGQVWRQYGSEYGDIDSWQVNQMGKRLRRRYELCDN